MYRFRFLKIANEIYPLTLLGLQSRFGDKLLSMSGLSPKLDCGSKRVNLPSAHLPPSKCIVYQVHGLLRVCHNVL